jgi:hypothetical protein
MNVRYTLSLYDMLAFQSYYNEHLTQAKNARFSARVGFPLIATAFSLLLAVNNPSFFTTTMFIIVLSLLFGFFFPLLSKYVSSQRFRKTHQGNTSEEFTFNLDEKGISSGSSKGKIDLFWNTIKDVVTTDTLVLFFYTPACAIIVPKSAIGDKPNYDNFIHLVQQYHTRPITQAPK